jgi:hypothetical protein
MFLNIDVLRWYSSEHQLVSAQDKIVVVLV